MINQKPEVSIVADSITSRSMRITTFKLRYWRPIHSELMTHRDFSRNAGSSRARPVKAVAQGIIDNPWGPREFGANQAGMQSAGAHDSLIKVPAPLCPSFYFWEIRTERSHDDSFNCSPAEFWEFLAWVNGHAALAYSEAGFHKQVANRITEPYGFIDVLVTATKFNNFFTLRVHPDAQPEIFDLASDMQEAMSASIPDILVEGEWHLPFVTDETKEEIDNFIKEGLHENYPFLGWVSGEDMATRISLCISTARCARVSYKMYDGSNCNIHDDLVLFDRLVGAKPLHASPAEHQAMPDKLAGGVEKVYARPQLSGNLGAGWIQFRKLLPEEYAE